MKISKAAALAASAVMIMSAFAGCGSTETTSSGGGSVPVITETTPAATEAETTPAKEVPLYNFDPPQIGEKIAVITVKDYGVIKIKLFPEQAQKGVENFIGLAENNYYDELIFHRIIPHFMNQGGDPKGTGTGGSSIWGDKFDGGIPRGLYHFSGAVAYANSSGPTTNGSQFYIVNTDPGECHLGGTYMPDGSIYYYKTFEEAGLHFPQNVVDMYMEKGGTPGLDGGYTVFGQVFEGLDVVRAMAKVETDENDKPLTKVEMESVRIVEYTGE